MKLTTSSIVDENKYEILGIVHGVSIRSFSFFRQFMGGLRSLIGGRAQEFEEKYLESWNEAQKEMVLNAEKMGAEAVYGVDVDVSELSMGRSDGMILIAASGTAVKKKQTGGKKNKKKEIT